MNLWVTVPLTLSFIYLAPVSLCLLEFSAAEKTKANFLFLWRWFLGEFCFVSKIGLISLKFPCDVLHKIWCNLGVFLFIIFTYLHSRSGFQGQPLYHQLFGNCYLFYRLHWMFKFCYYDLGFHGVSSNLFWFFSQLSNIPLLLTDTMRRLLKENFCFLQYTWKKAFCLHVLRYYRFCHKPLIS